MMAALSLLVADGKSDVLGDPEVLRLRADLAAELIHVQPSFGGTGLQRGDEDLDVGIFFSGLPEVLGASARAAAEAQRARENMMLSLGLFLVSPLAMGAGLGVGLSLDEPAIAGAGALVGLVAMIGASVALFVGQTAFFTAIHYYNDDLVRGRLDRSWIDEGDAQ